MQKVCNIPGDIFRPKIKNELPIRKFSIPFEVLTSILQAERNWWNEWQLKMNDSKVKVIIEIWLAMSYSSMKYKGHKGLVIWRIYGRFCISITWCILKMTHCQSWLNGIMKQTWGFLKYIEENSSIPQGRCSQ